MREISLMIGVFLAFCAIFYGWILTLVNPILGPPLVASGATFFVFYFTRLRHK